MESRKMWVNGHLVTLAIWPDQFAHATVACGARGAITVAGNEPKEALAGLLALPMFAGRPSHVPQRAA